MPQNYVNMVLAKHAVDPQLATKYYEFFKPYIEDWAKNCLSQVKISGSSKKGTAVANGTDVDLFISLSSTTNNTLKEIYDYLFDYLNGKGFKVRKQNVSIGVDYNGYQIDLVPAKRQGPHGNDHSLYVSKKNIWTKTNIDTHAVKVLGSNRLDEIKLTKIWRNQQGLDFPSFYLELLVIDALKHHTVGDTANNFLKVLQFIIDNIETRTYMDPANTNNCISDQIDLATKRRIAHAASSSINEQYWENIVS